MIFTILSQSPESFCVAFCPFQYLPFSIFIYDPRHKRNTSTSRYIIRNDYDNAIVAIRDICAYLTMYITAKRNTAMDLSCYNQIRMFTKLVKKFDPNNHCSDHIRVIDEAMDILKFELE